MLENWRAIPLGIPGTTTDPWLLNLNFPSFLSQQLVPVATMVGLPVMFVLFCKLLGWVHTRRDIALLIFSAFIGVYLTTTIVGTAFRGQGQDFASALGTSWCWWSRRMLFDLLTLGDECAPCLSVRQPTSAGVGASSVCRLPPSLRAARAPRARRTSKLERAAASVSDQQG